MLVRSARAAGAVAGLSLLLGLTVTQPASAADPVVTIVSRATGMTNFNEVLSTCNAPPGATCTLNVTKSATRTVDLALGVSRGFVTGKLNISNASTKTVSVTCSAVMSTKHSRMVAYPQGTQIFYKITSNGKTSGTLMAFDPSPYVNQGCFLYR